MAQDEQGETPPLYYTQLPAFDRLYMYVRLNGCTIPYIIEELGRPKYDLLAWVGHKLRISRRLGDFNLFIFCKYRSQKTLLTRLIAQFLRIYFPPSRLYNFSNATDDADLWILDEMSYSFFS